MALQAPSVLKSQGPGPWTRTHSPGSGPWAMGPGPISPLQTTIRQITMLSGYLERLEALMGWLKKTIECVQVNWIGDPLGELRILLYCDADFAGCQTTNRCTSGIYCAIEGPSRSFAVAATSKKQHHTSYSTAGAESTSGCFGVKASWSVGSNLVGRDHRS